MTRWIGAPTTRHAALGLAGLAVAALAVGCRLPGPVDVDRVLDAPPAVEVRGLEAPEAAPQVAVGPREERPGLDRVITSPFELSVEDAVLLVGCRLPGPVDVDRVLDAPPAVEVRGLEAPEAAPQVAVGPREERPGLDRVITSPLELSVEDAVLLALRGNRGLRVQQLDPLIAGTFEELERARFDPAVGAELRFGSDRRSQVSAATREIFDTRGNEQVGAIGAIRRLPTGTEAEVTVSTVRTDSDRAPEQFRARTGLTVSQALLRGASWEANTASIQQAQLDALASAFELRGVAEALVADVESTFWELLLAEQELAIFERSLAVAEQQARETRRRVEVGAMAATESAAARAEVARRHEELINARSRRRQLQLRLLRLMDPPSPAGWDLELALRGEAAPEPVELAPVAVHVELARRMRPELNEARLLLERGRLELVQTRNGLLPRLDLFVTLGKTGFARSFGDAWGDLDGGGYDLAAGIAFSLPVGNRAAGAAHERAGLEQRQVERGLRNLEQLVDLDVRLAYLEVERAREQIDATRATRELRAETLRAETEKFRVGASTSFLVAQAQRDLLESEIAEVRAMVNYRRTLIELYRLDGTLLLRRAIRAPGEVLERPGG